MCNALPRPAHGRSRRCHPRPPCRRLRAAAPTAESGRVVRSRGPRAHATVVHGCAIAHTAEAMPPRLPGHAKLTREWSQKGSVSKVDMATPIPLIYKTLFSSISTFETLPGLKPLHPRLELLWADGSYSGEPLATWCAAEGAWRLEVITPTPHVKGLVVRPWCWMVERTLGWLGRQRRLSKDLAGCKFLSVPMPGTVPIGEDKNRSPGSAVRKRHGPLRQQERRHAHDRCPLCLYAREASSPARHACALSISRR
jgi:hypothetical protein